VSTPGSGTRTFRQPNLTVTLDRAGVYTATLTVTDAARSKGTAS